MWKAARDLAKDVQVLVTFEKSFEENCESDTIKRVQTFNISQVWKFKSDQNSVSS